MMFFTVFLLCVILGAFVGFFAGLLGIGGGLIIVPALVMILPSIGIDASLIMKMALATSLASIVITSISAAFSHHKSSNIPLPLTKKLIVFVALGAVLGANLADLLPTDSLTFAFSTFVIILAAYMIFAIKQTKQRSMPSDRVLKSVAISTGSIASLMGISGGAVLIPFLNYCGVNLRHAIGVSTACGMIVSLFGTIAYVIAGLANPLLPQWSFGYVYLPAVLGIIVSSTIFTRYGVQLANRLPVKTIKKVFAAFLIIVAIKMMI